MSSSPRARDEGRSPIRELLQPGGNGKWRNGWRAESRDGRRSNGGESPTARFVSSRMLLLPSIHSRLRPRGFFLLRHSYFFYMPLSICSSNPPPSARTGHGAPLFNLTFSILSFFFLSFHVIVLRESQPKQPFENARRYAANSRQFLYEIRLLFASHQLAMSSADNSTLCARGFTSCCRRWQFNSLRRKILAKNAAKGSKIMNLISAICSIYNAF